MPAPPESAAREVVSALRASGHLAYYAGGCVRDRLLGLEPADYDVASSARPEDVQALFPRTVAVGAQFGVVCVMKGAETIQVATFRNDLNYLDGRHPSGVTFSTPEEDAQRRDFTINGMFFDPIAEEVIDFVGGKADLEARTIRAIGNPALRFEEDKLRLLRAIRFATVLDFQIEPSTWEALRSMPSAISAVSPERIREELVKLFDSPRRAVGLDLLRDSGLLREVLPEVDALQGCEQPPQFHPEGDVYIHTRIMLAMLGPNSPTGLTWATLLHDIGKPPTYSLDPAEGRIRFNNHDKVGAAMTERLLERLRFPRADIDAIRLMVDQHMVFKDVKEMRPAKLRRFMARPTFDQELELHRVDCGSSHGMLDNHEFLLAKQAEFANEPIIPPPLITGKDLIALGYRPGPDFGPILEAVQTHQLEGTLDTPEAAAEWVRANYPSPEV